MRSNIIFVLGPSGGGKSDLSNELDYEFYEIDQWPTADGIDAHGVRENWDEFFRSANAVALLDLLRSRADAAGKQGNILSFSSTFILRGLHLSSLKDKLRVVYHAARLGQCLDAFLARERQSGRGLNALHWAQNNQAMFDFLKTHYAKPHIVERPPRR